MSFVLLGDFFDVGVDVALTEWPVPPVGRLGVDTVVAQAFIAYCRNVDLLDSGQAIVMFGDLDD